MSTLKLLSGTRNASSWAMRAWLALHEAGIPFEEEIVDIRRPQRFDNLAQVARLTPSGTVPALETPGGMIFDSLAIMEYANDVAGGLLLPKDIIPRARARAVTAWQHGGLSQICRAISFESAFYSHKRALTPDEVAEAARVFRMAEALLEESDGPYLFGELSLADLSLVPTVVRLTRHGFDLSGHSRARTWTSELLARPYVETWLAEAATLEPIWYDDYLGQPTCGAGPLPTICQTV